MKALTFRLLLGLSLVPGLASAETAYVTDRLLLGLYADADDSSQLHRNLPSGTELDIQERRGLYARVMTAEGLEGWVKYHFLVSDPPAVVRVKDLEKRLTETAATQAQGTEGSNAELEALESQNLALNERLLQMQGELQLAQQALKETIGAAAEPQAGATAEPQAGTDVDLNVAIAEIDGNPLAALGAFVQQRQWLIGGVLLVSAVIGFLAGAGWMGSRVRRRFGGIKVW